MMDDERAQLDGREYFDRRAKFYLNEASWIRDPTMIESLLYPVDPLDSVLDVCSGPGILATGAAEAGCFAVAVDISEAMLALCNEAVAQVCATAEALPFSSRSFDLILCRQGLHYVTDLAAALGEMRRVSRREVRVANVVMFSPDDKPFWVDYARIVTPARAQYFESGELAKKMRESGMRVFRSDTVIDRTTLRASLRGLSSECQQSVLSVFARQPATIRESYAIESLGSDDYLYNVKWEFVYAYV